MHANSAQELQVFAFVLGRLEGIHEVGILVALLGDLLEGPFSVRSVSQRYCQVLVIQQVVVISLQIFGSSSQNIVSLYPVPIEGFPCFIGGGGM